MKELLIAAIFYYMPNYKNIICLQINKKKDIKKHQAIVYYVPREERTWTADISCKLPPDRRRGWKTRDVGWPILLPWSVYYFSSHGAESASFPLGSETEICHFRPLCEEKYYTFHGSKISQPTARVCYPRLRLGCQFTQAVDCPSSFLPRCVIYYFTIPGPKIPHSCFWAGSESGTFGQGMVKNYRNWNLLQIDN